MMQYPNGRADPQGMRRGKVRLRERLFDVVKDCSNRELIDKFHSADDERRADLLYAMAALRCHEQIGTVLRKDLAPTRSWSGTAYFLIRDRQYNLLTNLGQAHDHWRDDPAYLNWPDVPLETWRVCRPDPDTWIGSVRGADGTRYHDEVEYPFIQRDRLDILENAVAYSLRDLQNDPGNTPLSAWAFLRYDAPNGLSFALKHGETSADELIEILCERARSGQNDLQIIGRRSLRVVLRRLDQAKINDHAHQLFQQVSVGDAPTLKRITVTIFEFVDDWPDRLVHKLLTADEWWSGLGPRGHKRLGQFLTNHGVPEPVKKRTAKRTRPFPLRFDPAVVRMLNKSTAMTLPPELAEGRGGDEKSNLFRAFERCRRAWAPRNASLNGRPRREAELILQHELSSCEQLQPEEITEVYRGMANPLNRGLRTQRRLVRRLMEDRVFPPVEQFDSVLNEAPDPIYDELMLQLPRRTRMAARQHEAWSHDKLAL